jgi:hypothetical protein
MHQDQLINEFCCHNSAEGTREIGSRDKALVSKADDGAMGLCPVIGEDHMRRITMALIVVLMGTLPAVPPLAAEMPSRKAGLWEIKASFENRNVPSQTIQQCTDMATDEALQSNAGQLGAQRTCSKREVGRSGNTVTIDSTCTVGGRTATSHAVIAGDFNSAYTMTITTQVEGVPGGARMTTMSAKWLGPCAADQKPGDMFVGGRKFNINDPRSLVPPRAPGPAGIPAPPR